jgi:chitinase
VNLTLSNPVGASLFAGGSTATLTISQPPPPIVQFTTSNYYVNESGGAGKIFVSLSKPMTQTVTVVFSTGGGTAVAGTNYTAVTNQTLTFSPGEGVVEVDVPVMDDGIPDPTLTVGLTLSSPSSNATLVGGQSMATLNIMDDDSVCQTVSQ